MKQKKRRTNAIIQFLLSALLLKVLYEKSDQNCVTKKKLLFQVTFKSSLCIRRRHFHDETFFSTLRLANTTSLRKKFTQCTATRSLNFHSVFKTQLIDESIQSMRPDRGGENAIYLITN